MKKTGNNKFSYYFMRFLSDTIFAMIFWPLLDILFNKKEFVYTVNEYVFESIMFGLFSVLFTYIFNKKDPKKENSSIK